MSKLWVFTDCVSPTSHGSLRYFSVITSKGDLLSGFPLSFCRPSDSLGKCAFLPWGGKEGTCFRLVPLAPHEVVNLQQCSFGLAFISCYTHRDLQLSHTMIFVSAHLHFVSGHLANF